MLFLTLPNRFVLIRPMSFVLQDSSLLLAVVKADRSSIQVCPLIETCCNYTLCLGTFHAVALVMLNLSLNHLSFIIYQNKDGRFGF